MHCPVDPSAKPCRLRDHHLCPLCLTHLRFCIPPDYAEPTTQHVIFHPNLPKPPHLPAL